VHLSAPPLVPAKPQAGLRSFIGRQPIFDAQAHVFGYQLLSRTSFSSYFRVPDPAQPSQRTVDPALPQAIQSLAGGKRAFLTCDREDLLRGTPALLPADSIVIELPESISADPAVLAACGKLKAAGCLLALVDFVPCPERSPLAEMAHFLMLDLRVVRPVFIDPLVQRFGRPGLRLLASRVGTQREFALAGRLGFQYFQGNFFIQPEPRSARDKEPAQAHHLQLLRAATRTVLSLREIEEIMRAEPSLLYDLLHHLNSAAFGLRSEIPSLRHALTLLGEANLKKWISLVALSSLAAGKPAELVATCLVRARTCEMLASAAGMAAQFADFFLLGLFSALDAALDRPMEEALDGLGLPDPVRAALLGQPNRHRDLLDAVIACEKGQWKKFTEHCSGLRLSEDEVPPLFLDSVEWSRRVLHE
jgi:EAL and modified HD-GYP domain-containing signal transduction protein